MHSYTYDAENRIIKVDSGTTATYLYDNLNLRVQKVSGGTTADFLFDPNGNMSWKMVGGSESRGEIFIGSQHIATYKTGHTYFMHTNWLGSEASRTDESGTKLQDCEWNSYGQLKACTGASTDPYLYSWYQYAGYEGDPESGLYHMRYRSYNPRIGRFMSADLLSGGQDDPQSLNKFSYARSNPTNLIDPTGLNFIWGWFDFGGGGGGGGSNDDPIFRFSITVWGPGSFGNGGAGIILPGTCMDIVSDGITTGNTCGIRGWLEDLAVATDALTDGFFHTQRQPKETIVTCVNRVANQVSPAGLVDAVAGTNTSQNLIVNAVQGNQVSGGALILLGSNQERLNEGFDLALTEGSVKGFKGGLAAGKAPILTLLNSSSKAVPSVSKLLGNAVGKIAGAVKAAYDVGAAIGAAASCTNGGN